jgi:hypothetical protein
LSRVTDTCCAGKAAWTNVTSGSYSLTAVARDNGAMTVSSTRDMIVKPTTLPSTALFTPSSNHATAVDRYVLEVFPLGAETTVANPVSTQDLGKPAITNGEIRADISSTILALTLATMSPPSRRSGVVGALKARRLLSSLGDAR